MLYCFIYYTSSGLRCLYFLSEVFGCLAGLAFAAMKMFLSKPSLVDVLVPMPPVMAFYISV